MVKSQFSLIVILTILFFSCQKQIDYQPQINLLNNNLYALQKSRDSLAAALAQTNINLNQTNTNISSLSKSLDSIRTQLSVIGGQISTLNTQMSTANANITSINEQIASLNKLYNELLAKFNNLQAQLNSVGLANSLAAYYPFNGNANDSSGYGNNGTIIGASLAPDRNSLLNKCYQFNGTSNYISFSKPFLGGLQKSQISISLNFNLDQLPNTNNAYYLWSKNGFWQGLGISIDNFGRINFGGSITTYKYQNCYSATNVVNPGQWYNLVVVYDNIDCKMYLNGSLIQTTLETNNQSGAKLSNTMAGFVEFGQNVAGNSASTNLIGASHSVSTGYVTFFKGKIDEFRLYDRLLTQTEILFLSNN